ncbi:LysR substrate-binding domain-containing protein [Conexibacter sp. CPCC 206217]|uniref:LysR substrate-binding domain-containing protein n=1 Tax=Conexibacter sp. CPCC 206217 TaxID=3064574 RepID=UPI00271B72C7|nr:LysR substrate-binding domain-containing protein [Conexibacter sp. CPCC 206217]MDO8209809.1 LysR substrate-binding domain-containing protein [Conexibacter sp. CPCC 206217]
MRPAADELAGLVRGHVAVGMVPSGPAGYLADLLDVFHRAHPAVEVTLTEANSDELLTQLLDGQLDLVLAAQAGPPPAGIETLVILDEPLVAAVARGASERGGEGAREARHRGGGKCDWDERARRDGRGTRPARRP